ncbi:DUF2790 domain-containing protein [Pseudomonas lalucatii]|uniref:DUF2790 domain-containing protein n=1 Tax=Pseudomonas lalucatii TaxID=1424203 RepID=A0ABS5PX33_9PSED|nr:DUF2790 domain-containing protein [Pseudomonas lalucatii]MBS7661070.1 DUF2790 domain-containing protein [Pseudomonas lalucatii]MBS7724297.1 DUF2790 domain-containing protein [Pseudomonas lalucatii]QVM87714.1 DUF2790 domain-containing protein [Pseudomonas lalucatii]
MKNKAWLLSWVLLSPLVMADEPQTYHYGMPLDVAEVLSTSVPQGCQVVETSMIYKDSKGETHTLTYLRHGEDCPY